MFYLAINQGFAVFSVLGHMFLIKCVDSFDQVAAQGNYIKPGRS